MKTAVDFKMDTVMQHATKSNPEKLKPACYQCKKPGHHKNQWHQLKKEKDQTWGIKNSASNDNSAQTNPTRTATMTIQTTEMTETSEFPTHLVRPVEKQTTPQKIVILQPMQQTDHLIGIKDRQDKVGINDRT